VHKPETYDAGISHQIGRYSDAIRVPAGQGHDQIIVSGTPGLDENGAIPADFADEARQAWQNIGASLAKAGASVSDIVSGRQYLTRPEDIKAYVEVSKEMITHELALMLSVVSALVWPSIHVNSKSSPSSRPRATPPTNQVGDAATQRTTGARGRGIVRRGRPDPACSRLRGGRCREA
jgi:enamine deaminase RidA (YjgF/YER057c/UK114 family)